MHEQIEVVLARKVFVDALIAPEIVWLNAVGIETIGSCQGPPPTALIVPSSADKATELGYEPAYQEDSGLFQIELRMAIMRTLSEIIVAAKDGRMPSHEECYWAMLAFSHLGHFDHEALDRLAERGCNGPFGAEFQFEESFNRHKAALNESPREWIGWNNDPANPEYRKMRRAALKVFKEVIKDSA